ncbi:hypothetical protein FNF29_03487 [Cafeteria roenbergensis]|uniref:Uncharacterized protein n=1 Tax=Cafeteria roenbergensis TaxID=33653 RepID=A0A5A8CKB1_CAFRO|nr:hypothetical protein FNF29_03487 [Cafeteria roenbergensis]|eukprot:KAA0152964.1 hypothetical protein FNF29_03487 [Cafeteria roenbergensis]
MAISGWESGHVFIVRGDAAKVACDAQLVDYVAEDDAGSAPKFLPGDIDIACIRERSQLESPRFLVDFGPLQGIPELMEDVVSGNESFDTLVANFVEQSIRALVAKAYEALRTVWSAYIMKAGPPRFRRARPLVALPLLKGHLLPSTMGGEWVHTRCSVPHAVKAAVFDALNSLLAEDSITAPLAREMLRAMTKACNETGIDVVLAAESKAQFVALQMGRCAARLAPAGSRESRNGRSGTVYPAWEGLSDSGREEARKLATHAASGHLTVFVGAGVSAGAGLPTWTELLKKLARRAHLFTSKRPRRASLEGRSGRRSAQRLSHAVASLEEQQQRAEAEFDRMDLMDQALLVEHELEKRGKKLGIEVARMLGSKEYALGHALVASLGAKNAVTTNYDTLLEDAIRSTNEAISVMPNGPDDPKADRWLLKMHGCVLQPSGIVLTRADYARFSEESGALRGVVQASLMTSHMLMLGFGLQDPNFYSLYNDVERAVKRGEGVGGQPRRLGTVITLQHNSMQVRLWERRLHFVWIDKLRSAAESGRKIGGALPLMKRSATGPVGGTLRPARAEDETDAALLAAFERANGKRGGAHAEGPSKPRQPASRAKSARFLAPAKLRGGSLLAVGEPASEGGSSKTSCASESTGASDDEGCPDSAGDHGRAVAAASTAASTAGVSRALFAQDAGHGSALAASRPETAERPRVARHSAAAAKPRAAADCSAPPDHPAPSDVAILARLHDVFLDFVVFTSFHKAPHRHMPDPAPILGAERIELNSDDWQLRQAVQKFLTDLPQCCRMSPAFEPIAAAVRSLGGQQLLQDTKRAGARFFVTGVTDEGATPMPEPRARRDRPPPPPRRKRPARSPLHFKRPKAPPRRAAIVANGGIAAPPLQAAPSDPHDATTGPAAFATKATREDTADPEGVAAAAAAAPPETAVPSPSRGQQPPPLRSEAGTGEPAWPASSPASPPSPPAGRASAVSAETPDEAFHSSSVLTGSPGGAASPPGRASSSQASSASRLPASAALTKSAPRRRATTGPRDTGDDGSHPGSWSRSGSPSPAGRRAAPDGLDDEGSGSPSSGMARYSQRFVVSGQKASPSLSVSAAKPARRCRGAALAAVRSNTCSDAGLDEQAGRSMRTAGSDPAGGYAMGWPQPLQASASATSAPMGLAQSAGGGHDGAAGPPIGPEDSGSAGAAASTHMSAQERERYQSMSIRRATAWSLLRDIGQGRRQMWDSPERSGEPLARAGSNDAPEPGMPARGHPHLIDQIDEAVESDDGSSGSTAETQRS